MFKPYRFGVRELSIAASLFIYYQGLAYITLNQISMTGISHTEHVLGIALWPLLSLLDNLIPGFELAEFWLDVSSQSTFQQDLCQDSTVNPDQLMLSKMSCRCLGERLSSEVPRATIKHSSPGHGAGRIKIKPLMHLCREPGEDQRRWELAYISTACSGRQGDWVRTDVMWNVTICLDAWSQTNLKTESPPFLPHVSNPAAIIDRAN